jgi:aspartyl-tRNA(Asn)/glutamyl-tRNA(Gln) amidotransferase subunit A
MPATLPFYIETICEPLPLDLSTEMTGYSSYMQIVEQTNNKIATTLIRVPWKYFIDYLHPEVEQIFYQFLESLKSMGCRIFDLDLHNTEKYSKTWSNIRYSEASDIHREWLKTRKGDYSEEVREMLIRGAKIPAIDYIQSLRCINVEIKKEFVAILNQKIDVIVIPTTVVAAPSFDDLIFKSGGDTVLNIREALLRNTIIFNAIGLPAITIPIGLTKNNNMPIGVQLIGAPFMESKILHLAYNYECFMNSVNKFIPSSFQTN